MQTRAPPISTSFIRQAKEDRIGGLLVMVSTKLANSSEIQFHAVHAPRQIIQVRVNRSQPIAILNAYQHTLPMITSSLRTHSEIPGTAPEDVERHSESPHSYNNA